MEIIGVVGAGAMGAGIAQVALEHGHEVVLHDVDEMAIERGRARVREGLARRAASLDLDADSIDDWVDGRLVSLRQAEALVSLAAETDVVIEAALENLPLKQDIFRALDAAADPGVILATNTSALRIADVAALAEHRERIVGLHFFNPAPVMRLVEVVVTVETDPRVADRATALIESWDKTPVRSADQPGFIVNRVNRPFTIEALRLVEAGEASVAAVDEAIRDAGFPMGPFELIDLVGVDINLAAATAIWKGLGRPGPLRPSPIQERLVAVGALGRKTGHGFYRYENGRQVGVSDEFGGAGSTIGPDAIRERILAAIGSEAHRAQDEGVASAADIDIALRLGAGHPLGPFERERGEEPARLRAMDRDAR